MESVPAPQCETETVLSGERSDVSDLLTSCLLAMSVLHLCAILWYYE